MIYHSFWPSDIIILMYMTDVDYHISIATLNFDMETKLYVSSIKLKYNETYLNVSIDTCCKTANIIIKFEIRDYS